MSGTSTRPKRRRLSPSIIIAMTALLIAVRASRFLCRRLMLSVTVDSESVNV